MRLVTWVSGRGRHYAPVGDYSKGTYTVRCWRDEAPGRRAVCRRPRPLTALAVLGGTGIWIGRRRGNHRRQWSTRPAQAAQPTDRSYAAGFRRSFALVPRRQHALYTRRAQDRSHARPPTAGATAGRAHWEWKVVTSQDPPALSIQWPARGARHAEEVLPLRWAAATRTDSGEPRRRPERSLLLESLRGNCGGGLRYRRRHWAVRVSTRLVVTSLLYRWQRALV